MDEKCERIRRVAEIVADIERGNEQKTVYTVELSTSERWLLAHVLYSEIRASMNVDFVAALQPILDRLGGHKFLGRRAASPPVAGTSQKED